MSKHYVIIEGEAESVQAELNRYDNEYWIEVISMATSLGEVTVLITISEEKPNDE